MLLSLHNRLGLDVNHGPSILEMSVLPNVAVVGATGAVGDLMRQVLLERDFKVKSIKFLASERSAGKAVHFAGKQHTIELIRPVAFSGVDIVLSSTPASISKEFSPIAAKAGAIVIDNSSAWRMDPDVPLVVPEVNGNALKQIRKGIVANPNCSTIQMVVALKPLHDLAGIKRIVVSTYQASSGKGAKGVTELDAQLQAIGRGEPIPPVTAHAAQLAGNVVTLDWKLGEDGYTEEEIKMIRETQKIMGDETILVSPTCARVPVRTGHSESINVEFHRPITVQQARDALLRAPGVVLLDNPEAGHAPSPLHAAGQDHTFVGRIRKDPSAPNCLNLWVVADNLRKGAATNAVQIAEELLRRGIL